MIEGFAKPSELYTALDMKINRAYRRQREFKKDRIILRDHLSLERTRLANERTLMAYIRSSLYLVVGGIAFLNVQELQSIQWAGYLSFLISIVVMVIGVIKYMRLRSDLMEYYDS